MPNTKLSAVTRDRMSSGSCRACDVCAVKYTVHTSMQRWHEQCNSGASRWCPIHALAANGTLPARRHCGGSSVPTTIASNPRLCVVKAWNGKSSVAHKRKLGAMDVGWSRAASLATTPHAHTGRLQALKGRSSDQACCWGGLSRQP